MTVPSITQLREEHAQLRDKALSTYQSQHQPEFLLNRLSDISDRTLQKLTHHFPLPPGAALAAVGGYGRGELYPHSDVDVLVLLATSPDPAEVDAIEGFVAAMWDVGLEPGHSVRSIDQCKNLAGADVTIETALLEARWLAGNKTLVEELLTAMQKQLNPQRFFLAKRAEMRQRHVHFHDTPYALEPNCKESPGGLRDLQLLLWLAQAAGYGSSWIEVMGAGGLTAAEYRSLRRAENAFKRLRVELHLLTDRREDRLLFDLQPALARIYGFKETRTREPSELLMQRYYWAARVVRQLSMVLTQSIEETLFKAIGPARRLDNDFYALEGRLDIQRDDGFARNPALIFRAFLCLQEHPELTGMTARTLRAMWHARRRIDTQFRNNPINQDAFLRILKQPYAVSDILYQMTMLNILPRYLPVFRRIVGQMQHDLFHAYTVDEHTLKVIHNLHRFTDPTLVDEYPLASQLMSDVGPPWMIYIAALFHDIAKGRGEGNHAELGAVDVQHFCRQHRIEDSETEFIVFLVRNHLLMSIVAQKHDLSNPHVIHEFATQMGSERRLRALYLLTVADIRATNPTVWNSWKGKLLETLYHRTLLALGGRQPDTSMVLIQRRQQAADAIRALGVDDTQRDAFWNVLDDAYFLRHEPNEIVWHAEQIASCLHDTRPVVRARILGRNEALQVMVYTQDRDDLFASICQYFDRQALSIQDARIHTTEHGWALDSFIVLFAHHDAAYQDVIGSVQRELAAHLRQSQGLPMAPAGRKRQTGSRHRRARTFPIIPQIDLRPDQHSDAFQLAIVCADRAGLLYDLAVVFREYQISLKMAKIHTLGERVEDVFTLKGDTLMKTQARVDFKRALSSALMIH